MFIRDIRHDLLIINKKILVKAMTVNKIKRLQESASYSLKKAG